MAAPTPLSILVLLSQRRAFLHAERARSTRESARAERRAKSASSQAYMDAVDAYLEEGYRILHQRTVVVHSVEEIEVLIALFQSYEPPYRLNRVTVNGPLPAHGEMADANVQQMRERLEEADFELVEGRYRQPKLPKRRCKTGLCIEYVWLSVREHSSFISRELVIVLKKKSAIGMRGIPIM